MSTSFPSNSAVLPLASAKALPKPHSTALETASLSSPILNVFAERQAHPFVQQREFETEGADPFLQYPLRLGGFLNELEAATSHLLPAGNPLLLPWKMLTWGLTWMYAFANATSRGMDTYRDAKLQTKDETTAEIHGLKEGLVTAVYQLAASVYGPVALAIHPAQHAVKNLFSMSHGKHLLSKTENHAHLTELVQKNLGAFKSFDKDLTEHTAEAFIKKLNADLKTPASNFIQEAIPAAQRQWGRFVGKAADQTTAHAIEKLGQLHLKSIPAKAFTHNGAALLKLGAIQTLVGFGAVAAWLMTADKVLDKVRENFLLPFSDHVVNHYLHKNGHVAFWPEEDKKGREAHAADAPLNQKEAAALRTAIQAPIGLTPITNEMLTQQTISPAGLPKPLIPQANNAFALQS